MESRKILGVRVDFGLNYKDVLDIIEDKLLKDGKNHIICTTNPEFIMDAQKDLEFKEIINESDLSVPDGSGVVFAKNYLDTISNFKRSFLFPLRAFLAGCFIGMSSFFSKSKISAQKITGVNLTYKICELSSKKGYNIFFLGGRAKNILGKYTSEYDRDTATLAAKEIRKLYPGINIIGSTSMFSYQEKDDQETIKYINKCMDDKGVDYIDFLFVAYPHSKQERWIVRNNVKINAKVSIGCGGTFDYIVGQCKLPRDIYVQINLEWLYRLIKQPWRIKRIIKAFPLFPLNVFFKSLAK